MKLLSAFLITALLTNLGNLPVDDTEIDKAESTANADSDSCGGSAILNLLFGALLVILSGTAFCHYQSKDKNP